MTVDTVVRALEDAAKALNEPLPVRWVYPPRPPRRPLEVRPGPGWKEWAHDPMPMKAKAPNWAYAELRLPRRHRNVPLNRSRFLLNIDGWYPFRLWIDGEQVFEETHAWHATGPIVEPLCIDRGTHRMAVCIEPSAVVNPFGFKCLDIRVRPEACEQLATDIGAAAAQLRVADAVARTASDRRLVARAAHTVDLDALEAGNWDGVNRSLEHMERRLAPLSPRARALTVRLLGHAHIDMDWQWTWTDTVHCIRRDFKAVTDLMDDVPGLTFVISQVPSYDVVRKLDPDVFRKVRRFIREGRWENAAGTWVEGDLHMADGESVARHFQYAADWTRAQLGSKARVLWEPDTFGHPVNMPQLARLGDFDAYFHMRTTPGGEAAWPARTWHGIDGSDITALSSEYNGNLQPWQVVKSALNYLRFGLKDSLHIWGVGDHGGGLSRHELKRLDRYRERPLIPTVQFGSLREHLAAVRSSGVRLPVNRGETFSLFEGCWTTQARIKRDNRDGEGALLSAETLCALARLDRNRRLRDAWTPLLFNQFHDLLDGSSIHDAYVDAHARAERSLRTAARVRREAVRRLVAARRDGDMLAVINPLGFPRTEPVRAELPRGTTHLLDPDGRAVPVQRMDRGFVFIADAVPAFGRRRYRIARGRCPASASGADTVQVSEPTDTHKDGQYFRVETAHAVAHLFKGSGIIGAYYDKRLRRDLVAYGVPKALQHTPGARMDLGLNVFQVIDETPNNMSAWLINAIRREENLVGGADVSLVETGPVFARFRVVHRFRASRIEQDIVFYHRFPRVDFKAVIDWRERGGPEQGVPQLKVAFTTAAAAVRARFEGPFSVVERPADGQEQPTQKWMDLSGRAFGFALYNDSRYGCDALGSRARLTLLRSAYQPDPVTDNAVHTVRFAFEPHPARLASAELVRRGMQFNRPVVCARTGRAALPRAPRLDLDGSDSVVCSALRRAEHADGLLVRLFEVDGRKASIRLRGDGDSGFAIRSAREVNLLEQPLGRPRKARNGTIRADFRPHEIKTFLLEMEDR